MNCSVRVNVFFASAEGALNRLSVPVTAAESSASRLSKYRGVWSRLLNDCDFALGAKLCVKDDVCSERDAVVSATYNRRKAGMHALFTFTVLMAQICLTAYTSKTYTDRNFFSREGADPCGSI
jgi:hypothetical protein